MELQHFSDASDNVYGQCSYLHLADNKGHVHFSFVMGNARVSPLKVVTIPIDSCPSVRQSECYVARRAGI